MGKSRSSRVAIIGGGPAGLTAAYYLQRAGFTNVTVLEREAELGGKCLTRYEDGLAYDMGAIELSPDYRNVLEIVDEMGLTMATIPEPVGIDPATGVEQEFRKLVFADGNALELVSAATRYLFHLARHRDSLARPGFRRLDPELCKPFATWLDEGGMKALSNGLLMPITCYGYGFLHEIPAVYALKYIDLRNFGLVLANAGEDVLDDLLPKQLDRSPEWPKRLVHGFGEFARRIADRVSVRRNVDLLQVQRGSTIHLVMRDRLTGVTRGEEFDELIVAMPQLLDRLSFLDLTADERDLFQHVVINHYATTRCEIDGIGNSLVLEVLSKGAVVDPMSGYPAQILRSWPSSKMCVAYTYSTGPITPAEVEANLADNLARMGKRLTTVRETKVWDYFPHVKGPALAEGFYDKLDDLQGQRSTYWAGGLLNFELVENVTAWSRALVERFFV